MLLEIKNLRVNYGGAEALRGVSLSIEEGSIVTLIGSNGAGKTTTLKAISGLVKPIMGEIYYQEKRIDGLPPQKIVKLGITHVPEGRRLFNRLTVKQNLEMGGFLLRTKKGLKEKIEMMINHFPNLKDKLNKQATQLSGGEQQMVAVSRALMSNPKLLLMDEPSLGLSPLMVAEVAKIITKINALGVSIILVEQNARMALMLAKTACVLEVGEIALSGDAKTIAQDKYVTECYLGGS